MQQRLLGILLLLTGFWACKKDSDSSIPVTSSDINVFSAVPGVQYDIALDTTFIGTIGTGQSTGYHGFQARRYNLNIYAPNNHDTPLGGGQVSLRNGYFYSVYLSLDHTNFVQINLVEDVLTKPQKNFSLLRVVDQSDSYYNATALSFGSPLTLDFYLDYTSKIVSRLNYQGVTPFIAIPAGLHSRDIRWADSTLSLRYGNDSSFTFEDGKTYSWIVYGNALVADSFKITSFTHDH